MIKLSNLCVCVHRYIQTSMNTQFIPDRFIQCHQLKSNIFCQSFPITSEYSIPCTEQIYFLVLQKGICHLETKIHKPLNFLNPIWCLLKLHFGQSPGECISINQTFEIGRDFYGLFLSLCSLCNYFLLFFPFLFPT